MPSHKFHYFHDFAGSQPSQVLQHHQYTMHRDLHLQCFPETSLLPQLSKYSLALQDKQLKFLGLDKLEDHIEA